MEAEKIYQEKTARTLQAKKESCGTLQFMDNRPMNQPIQQVEKEDDTPQKRFEKYLKHETWHVVQQMAERMEPTKVTKVALNDTAELEHEADAINTKAKKH